MATEIPLTKGYVAIVDDEDAPALMQHKWCASVGRQGVYARRGEWTPDRSKCQSVKMHRVITCAPPGVQVDHINGDTLDNRRANLRLVTVGQNHANRRADRGNRSGFKGVEPRPNGLWRARIGVNGRVIRLGHFATAEDAARAYDHAARQAFGPYACLNFPEPSGRSAVVR